MPSDAGGYGYDVTGEARPDCPECNGLGQPYTRFADTRKLTGKAALLYRGMKETRQGKEVLMHDPFTALELIAKRYGLLKEVVDLTVNPMQEMLQRIGAKGSAAPIATNKKED